MVPFGPAPCRRVCRQNVGNFWLLAQIRMVARIWWLDLDVGVDFLKVTSRTPPTPIAYVFQIPVLGKTPRLSFGKKGRIFQERFADLA